jgi:diguanylate cyclase (GGDEF)-like protein/PAS domain S-box-containing protein
MTAQARILVVDDSPSDLQDILRALADEYDVSVAESAASALTLAREIQPDLVLLNARMGEMDDLDAVQHFSRINSAYPMPVILLISENHVDQQVTDLDRGADDFIAKPITGPVLRARVRAALERKLFARTLHVLNRDLVSLRSNDLYRGACRLLTESLGTDCAFVGTLDAHTRSVRVVDGWGDGQPLEPFVYELEGTPCSEVMSRGAVCFPRDVQSFFPRDAMLVDMGIGSYVGNSLVDKQGQILGILVTVGRLPLEVTLARIAPALLELFIDRIVSEIERSASEQRIQSQLEFQRLAADAATALATATTEAATHAALSQCLRRLGIFFAVDRCYVFEFSDDLSHMSNSYEWCADGIQAFMDELQNIPIGAIPWWREELQKKGDVSIPRVADLPPEAAAERGQFEAQGIQSLVLVAMHGASGKFTGFVGFDSVLRERDWPDDEVTMLKTMAGIIGAAIERQRIGRTLARQTAYRAQIQRLSLSFINLPLDRVDGAIDTALERIGTFFGADRANFFVYDLAADAARNTHEWCALGIASQIRHRQNLPISDIQAWWTAHQQGKAVLIEDATTLPPGALGMLGEPGKIASVLNVPLVHSGNCLGFVGIETVARQVVYGCEERELLGLFAQLLVNVELRKFSEQALRETEQRFHRLFEYVPNVAVQGYDHQRCVIFWNKASEILYGYAREEALGRRLEELIVPETERQATIDEVTTWLQTGTASPAEEVVMRHKDGTFVPVFSSHAVQPGAAGPEIYCIDISLVELKQAEEQLRQAASVFEHANEGIAITDTEGTILDVNAAFTRITGYLREEVLGQNPRMLKSERHDPAFYQAIWRLLESQGSWTGEIWNRRKNGEVYPGMLTISTVYDSQDRPKRYVALFSDISAQKAHQRQLEHIAHYDALTGLPNRVLLADRMQQAMEHAKRRDQQIAVVYLDLDGFKAINDRYGHDTGDRLLTKLGERMRRVLRKGDTLARLGGDEFVAVLVDLTDADTYLPLLQRLQTSVVEPVNEGALTFQVSASVGVSFFPQAEAIDADQLLRQADHAMYQAKVAGKNRYHVFDAAHDRHLRGRHETIARLTEALANREFVLVFQPKVNMREGSVVGAEALIRWQHPERGLLPPDTFLPVLANHALMIELGDWVIETALTQIAAWRDAGITLPVSVNIDATQLNQPDFVDKLQAALQRHPSVQRGDLELEVLETSALHDVAGVSEILRAGEALGIPFSLDDFGTGYSSLTYLKRLPVASLKIDQTFVRDMLEDPDDLAILEGIIGLATSFQRKVIAEGVETEAHGQTLLQLGCELGQGYAIAKPMPAAEIPSWIARWQPSASWAETTPIPRDALPVLYCMAERRLWLSSLQNYLKGERSDPPTLDPSRNCHLGRWLERNSRTSRSNRFEYARIGTLHERTARQGIKLVKLKECGDADRALSGFPEIQTMHQELLDALRRWLH